jgi:hypothetical protein
LSYYTELLTQIHDSVPGPFEYTIPYSTTIISSYRGLQLFHIVNSGVFENAETEELFLMMTRKSSVIIIRKYVGPAVEK